jgi:hypothetical protein
LIRGSAEVLHSRGILDKPDQWKRARDPLDQQATRAWLTLRGYIFSETELSRLIIADVLGQPEMAQRVVAKVLGR